MIAEKTELRATLERHLAGKVSSGEIDALAADLEKIGAEWVEVRDFMDQLGFNYVNSTMCRDICLIGDVLQVEGGEVRLFHKAPAE